MNVIFWGDQSKVYLHLELKVTSPFPVAFLVVCLFPPFSLLIFPAQSSMLTKSQIAHPPLPVLQQGKRLLDLSGLPVILTGQRVPSSSVLLYTLFIWVPHFLSYCLEFSLPVSSPNPLRFTLSTSHSLNAQLGNRAWQRTGLPKVLAEKKKRNICCPGWSI